MLKHLESVAFSLSREFTYDDMVSLATSVFAVVEHAEKMKQPVKRKNRLLRLEVVLWTIADADEIPMSTRRRAMANEYLTNCRKSLNQLRASIDSSDGASASTEAASQHHRHQLCLLRRQRRQARTPL